jgi:hypothetical protein
VRPAAGAHVDLTGMAPLWFLEGSGLERALMHRPIVPHPPAAGRWARLILMLVLAAALAPSAAGATCPGQCQTIAGNPLVVKASADTALQVYYAGDTAGQVFPSASDHGNAGTYVAADGALYGPSGATTYAEVSQSGVSGAGTAASPFAVTTVVDVGATGIRLTETITMVNGQPYFRIDRRLENRGPAPKRVAVFHYADLFLRGSDRGFGYFDPATRAIGGQTPAADFFQIFAPITPASHYEEGSFSTVFSRMSGVAAGGPPLADTLLPPPDAANIVDNGAALQWDVALPSGGSRVVSDFWSFGVTPQVPTAGPPAPDLSRAIPAPQVIRSGPARVTAPRRISLRSLRRSRCVLTRVVSLKPARVLVTIFSGIRSRRLFGADLVRFRAPGRKTPCIPVPLRARTFDARTRLRVAVGVALGAVDVVGERRQPRLLPVIRPIRLVP